VFSIILWDHFLFFSCPLSWKDSIAVQNTEEKMRRNVSLNKMKVKAGKWLLEEKQLSELSPPSHFPSPPVICSLVLLMKLSLKVPVPSVFHCSDGFSPESSLLIVNITLTTFSL
jgi:hypothetical protein